MKAPTKSRVLPDAPPHYIAVRDRVIIGMTVGNTPQNWLNAFCRKYDNEGATIYRAEQWFVVLFIGEKIPEKDLARLELAVTSTLGE